MNEHDRERPTLTPHEAAQERAGQNEPVIIDTHGETLPSDDELRRIDSHNLERIANALEGLLAQAQQGPVVTINGQEFNTKETIALVRVPTVQRARAPQFGPRRRGPQ